MTSFLLMFRFFKLWFFITLKTQNTPNIPGVLNHKSTKNKSCETRDSLKSITKKKLRSFFNIYSNYSFNFSGIVLSQNLLFELCNLVPKWYLVVSSCNLKIQILYKVPTFKVPIPISLLTRFLRRPWGK